MACWSRAGSGPRRRYGHFWWSWPSLRRGAPPRWPGAGTPAAAGIAVCAGPPAQRRERSAASTAAPYIEQLAEFQRLLPARRLETAAVSGQALTADPACRWSSPRSAPGGSSDAVEQRQPDCNGPQPRLTLTPARASSPPRARPVLASLSQDRAGEPGDLSMVHPRHEDAVGTGLANILAAPGLLEPPRGPPGERSRRRWALMNSRTPARRERGGRRCAEDARGDQEARLLSTLSRC